ncbi:restriction endonuclease subunit S [Aquibium sp. A9E412]|uniref:restriction endonuclease subunit S n=1 Tax=Aquibium sp. A9E412 TaxID=2976767 RepID=UPI0025B1B47E|nr:restriction endonuclease subunit S [Aquibium sp. A9E412]MDN2565229.1 restriction endonuclease subunit S [Aquibium sp. A9E412]
MATAKVPLSDLISLVSDPCRVDPRGSYPNLGIYSFARGVFGKPPIDGAQTSATTLYRVRSGQFIYSRLFAFEGAYAIVPAEMDGVFVSNEYPTFEVDQDHLLPRYLYWLFQRRDVWRQVAVGAKGMGDRRQRVHPDKVLSYRIDLPSLGDQHRIVEKLDRVAALVDERRNAIEAAERETQALLLKAFQRAIDGAPLRPMAEVAPLVRREVEIEATREYTEIGVRSFYNGIFHRRTMPGSEFSWQSLFWVKEGDLVFSNLMAWEKAIAVAEAHDEGTVGNHRMLTCEVNPKLATPGFLMAYFRTYEGFSSIVGHSPGTIARNKTLSSKKLPTILVPTPPVETQKWFDRLRAKTQEAHAIRANTAQDVESLIPAMLHEIFNGGAKAA